MGDRHELPDAIYTNEQAAQVARALCEFYEEAVDEPLARLANNIASVAQARSQDLGDTSRYGARVTFVDDDDGDPHTAIVLEPSVTSMQVDEAWDPYREEYVNPQEAYPLGTVQLIYPEEGQFTQDYFFDRLSGLACATSVTPASTPEQTHTYYAGWDYALDHAGD